MILEQCVIRGQPDGIVDHRSPPEAKVALFRALFRGREDLYPRRFESRKTGKTGYQPACANDRRCRGYEAVGYAIVIPASAVPGWPADVPLPVDPQWKREYAGSVQRLIRDGVDTPLANLFVNAVRVVASEAEGADRARSATVAFLYRRLEMLRATMVRFRLNVALPIAFDNSGQMEVDLLCADARLAIELDGAQHLESTESYRRDRRKDQLLQENGYFVLRFLAEDVGKKLDMVLDTIQRALFCRRK
jgi:very-short-patch-repair endonuclease